MAAHMLHKEYGNVSPWISVGGYAVATATGATRMLNNKHWMSDILAGAGIGILAVEFGYLFADLIFKENGLENFIEPDFSIPQRRFNNGFIATTCISANRRRTEATTLNWQPNGHRRHMVYHSQRRNRRRGISDLCSHVTFKR